MLCSLDVCTISLVVRLVRLASCLQALSIQVELYHCLGSGPAAFLYGQIANEEEASLEERAQYRLLEVAAQASPNCADGGSLDPARPRVNPAFLLGVAPDTNDTVVSLP